MATIFHLGSFGSGKSYGAFELGVYRELLEGKRGIVTNLSLLQNPRIKGQETSKVAGIGALNELIHRRFPKMDCNVLGRVRILTEDEVPYFFCHRIDRDGHHYDIPVPAPDLEKRGERPDFSLLRDDGIVFIIDEFHDFFNSRAWADVGRSVGWYKNQQRKLNDDIHACTPQIDEVDKQMRTIGHEYRVYLNLGLRKVRGVVLPQTFLTTCYSSLASLKAGRSPLNRWPWTMDFELANCYDTAKGVRGIQGSSADIGKRPKGLHWSVFPIVFIGLLVAIFYLFHLGKKKFVGAMTGRTELVTDKARLSAGSQNPFFPNRSTATDSTNTSSPDVTASPSDTNEVVCTGYIMVVGQPICFLSDGREAESKWGEVQLVSHRYVICFGKLFKMAVEHDSQNSYVPSPSPLYDLPPSVPVESHDNVSVTYIGQGHREPPSKFQHTFSHPVVNENGAGNEQAYPLPSSMAIQPQTQGNTTTYNFGN